MASLNFRDLPIDVFYLLKLSLSGPIPWKDFLIWSLVVDGVLLLPLFRRFANYVTCPGPMEGALFIYYLSPVPPLSLFKGELLLEFPKTD